MLKKTVLAIRFCGWFAMVFAVLCVLTFPHAAHAQMYDGKATCKEGVHMISPSDDDFKHAAELLNSNGGRYCWVTIVVREDEMTPAHLQHIHNLAREYKLQIIHRIEKGFTKDGKWLMPDEGTVLKFISAMNQITPSSNKTYEVLGNEPTHADMCGGCTPASYAHWAARSVELLHGSGARFNAVVMLAGQDLHSPQAPPHYYDAGVFLEGMVAAEPQLLCDIDAWASHDYGSAHSVGRYSATGYKWELGLLERLAPADCKGHVRDLPVFITETGYQVGAGFMNDTQALRETTDLLSTYASDSQVAASVLFAYHACGQPFEAWALSGCEGDTLNGVGQALAAAPKVTGDVEHIYKARTKIECPTELVENTPATCILSVENKGSDIWSQIDGTYSLALLGTAGAGSGDDAEGVGAEFSTFRAIHPGETLSNTMTYNPGSRLGAHDISVGLFDGGRLVLGLSNVTLVAYEAPTAELELASLMDQHPSADEVQVQVFDPNERIVYRTRVPMVDGSVKIGKVEGAGYASCYRLVLLSDGNLPVQKNCVRFNKEGTTIVELPRLLPFDRDGDGRLSLSDLLQRNTNL